MKINDNYVINEKSENMELIIQYQFKCTIFSAKQVKLLHLKIIIFFISFIFCLNSS